MPTPELAPHLGLFKSAWLRDPDELQERARHASGGDSLTVELAAWCAEVHEHLQELAEERSMPLMLMGGNATALRVEVSRQRGSRDNDYLTTASKEDIQRLMDAFAARFEAVHPLFVPKLHVPKAPTKQLAMVTYLVPIPLQLDHGRAPDPSVKVEFHIEPEMPPGEFVIADFGPMAESMRAEVPKLPYQIVLKLMTLPDPPVGVPEARIDAIPRQLYDIDDLMAQIDSDGSWLQLVEYADRRYEREARENNLSGGIEPFLSQVHARLEHWADCLDRSGQQWKLINAMQQSQVRREAHVSPYGWRGRACRLRVAARSMEHASAGFDLWRRARAVAQRVPRVRAKALKTPLASVVGVDPRDLPVELHDYVWELMATSGDLRGTIERLETALPAAP